MAPVTSLGFSIFARTKSASNSLKVFGKEMDDLGKSWVSTGEKMTGVGKTLTTTVTAPVLAAGAAATKMAGEFETGMANVATLIPGNAARIRELGGDVKNLSVEFGKSTDDMTDGLYNVVSAFGDSSESSKLLEINARAAAAGMSTTTDAINLTSAVTKGYGDTSQDAVQHASDLALLTVRMGQTTFPELASSIGAVIPLASELGVTQEEVFATMATFTGVTGNASEVTTQLKNALGAVMAPSEAAADAFEEAGFKSGKAAIEALGLEGALGLLTTASATSGDPLQKFIGTVEGQTLALGLAGAQSDDYAMKLGEMGDAAGVTDAAFDEVAKTAEFKVAQAMSSLKVAAIELGEILLPFVGQAAEKVRELASWVGDLDARQQKWVVGLALAAATLGPLLIMIGQSIVWFAKVRAAFIALNVVLAIKTAFWWGLATAIQVAFSPITLVILAVVALIAVFWLAYKRIDWFKNVVDKAWAAIAAGAIWLWEKAIKPAWEAIVDFTMGKVVPAVLWLWEKAFKPAIQGISAGAIWLWEKAIKPAFEGIKAGIAFVGTAAVWLWDNAIKPAFNGIMVAFQFVADVAIWLWQSVIKPVFRGIHIAISIPIVIVVGILMGLWWLIKNVIAPIFVWIWQKIIRPVFTAVVSFFKNIVAPAFTWLWQKIIRPVFQGIGALAKWLWNNAIKPAFAALVAFYKNVLAPAFTWLWQKIVRPVFTFIGDKAKWLWNNAIRPAFNSLRKGIDSIVKGFQTAKNAIGKAWDGIKSAVSKPIKWVIENVYNKGIVPLWNKVADKVPGIAKLKPMSFVGAVSTSNSPGGAAHGHGSGGLARGGIVPGQSSWRGGDTHLRPMREGEGVYVSEALRDPYERWRLHAVNAAAMQGKNLRMFRDMVPDQARSFGFSPAAFGQPPIDGFSRGGIVGEWLSSKWDSIVGGLKSWATKPLNALREQVAARLGKGNNFAGIPYGFITKVREKILSKLGKEDETYAASMMGGAADWKGLESASVRLRRAANWARTQHGKPYQWGGGGNPSWDCSGFMAGIEQTIRGNRPGRLYSTHAFRGRNAPAGWKQNAASPFRVGVTHAGVGHMSGTLMGVNVESAGGGKGVVVGTRARGANDRMYTSRYGFMPVAGDSTNRPANAELRDRGGRLRPGTSLIHNGLGHDETVLPFPPEQLRQPVINVAAPEVRVYIGDEEITDRVEVMVDHKIDQSENRQAFRAKHGRR